MIEARVHFLNKIPVTPHIELTEGTELPGDVNVEWERLVGGIVSTTIMDHGVSGYMYSTTEKLIKVVDQTTLEVEQEGKRIILQAGEINRSRISSPTMIPGFRIHYSWRCSSLN